ncbi:MAG TPA: hypothetical protein VK790_13535 [Solirubrobacteraceae bacterium]|jgi:hypothetical protein|nr:hypothetical protein [Solirubrobacteraceae bacterium]
MDAADRLADELGTTTNDAIVRLAEEGVAVRDRREQIAALASERRAAVELVSLDDTSAFPAVDDLREAMLAGRGEP